MNNGIKVDCIPSSSPYIENWTTDGNYWSPNHRLDGPACIRTDESIKWCVNGNEYHNINSFLENTDLTKEEKTFLILKYGHRNSKRY